MDGPTFEAFAGCVGESFTVRTAEGATALRVSAVHGDAHPGADGWQRFSVRFESGAVLAQGTYEFAHGAVGTFECFIVPTDGTGDITGYEAAFMRRPISSPPTSASG